MPMNTLAFPTPVSLGSLDHYIQAVNRFPLLTAEQETELGRKLQRDNDLEAARSLVLSHLRLVVAAIAKTRPLPLKLIGVGEGIDDLRPFRAAEFADALIG